MLKSFDCRNILEVEHKALLIVEDKLRALENKSAIIFGATK